MWEYTTSPALLLPLLLSVSSLCSSHEDHEVEVSESMPEQKEEDGASNSGYSFVHFLFSLGLWGLLPVGTLAVESPRRALHSWRRAERPLSSLRGQELPEVRNQDRPPRSSTLPGSAGPGSGRVRLHFRLEALHSLWREHVHWGCPLCRVRTKPEGLPLHLMGRQLPLSSRSEAQLHVRNWRLFLYTTCSCSITLFYFRIVTFVPESRSWVLSVRIFPPVGSKSKIPFNSKEWKMVDME